MHKLSPENENLSPYLDSLSPVMNELSPAIKQDLSTISLYSGDTGYSGDKLNYIMADNNEDSINNNKIINKTCIDCPIPSDIRISHNHPLFTAKSIPR